MEEREAKLVRIFIVVVTIHMAVFALSQLAEMMRDKPAPVTVTLEGRELQCQPIDAAGHGEPGQSAVSSEDKK